MPRRPDRGPLAAGQPSADLPAIACTLLLAAAVAAAVAVAMVRLTQPDPPRIASVRLGELTARFALAAAGHDNSEAAAAAEARHWAMALERALAALAETHHAVLLPARAVAAGAPDLTAEVEATLARALQETAADAPAAPAGVRP